MRVLLHCCCGPCATSVVEYLRSRGDTVEGWFLNPNLYPEEEWERRRQAFAQAAQAMGLATLPSRRGEGFLDFLLALARHGGRRCEGCYRLRLEAAARAAAAHGYEGFATTLTISPYQDLEAIRRIGEEAGARHGVEFVFSDLRDRHRESQGRARELGLYRQNYCGCLFSALERAEGRAQKAVEQGMGGELRSPATETERTLPLRSQVATISSRRAQQRRRK